MSETTNETILVRISAEAHNMLREIATAQRRTMGAQAEVIIEAAWNNMQSNPPVAPATRPSASTTYPAIPFGG